MEQSSTTKVQFVQKLRDVEAASEDIKTLATNIQALSEMMEELKDLIEMTGEQIDLVEENVDQAHSFMEKGLVELDGVIAQQKKQRYGP